MQPLTKIILAKLRKAHSTDLFHSNHSAHKTQKNMTYPFAKKKRSAIAYYFITKNQHQSVNQLEIGLVLGRLWR